MSSQISHQIRECSSDLQDNLHFVFKKKLHFCSCFDSVGPRCFKRERLTHGFPLAWKVRTGRRFRAQTKSPFWGYDSADDPQGVWRESAQDSGGHTMWLKALCIVLLISFHLLKRMCRHVSTIETAEETLSHNCAECHINLMFFTGNHCSFSLKCFFVAIEIIGVI